MESLDAARFIKKMLRRRGKSGHPVTVSLSGRTLDNVSQSEANWDIFFPIYIRLTKNVHKAFFLSKRAFGWKEITRL